MTLRTETALIAAVPEVESLVRDVRAQHDPAAAEGVPAHVTVVYPFLRPQRVSTEVLRTLTDVFAKLRRFHAEFSEIRRFPGVLYLAPEPDSPFRRLTEEVVGRFPEAPPYGGQFADIVPHLTIAHTGDAQRLEHIERHFERSARSRLPIRAVIREVTLIEKEDGRWRARFLFALNGGSTFG